MTTAARMQQDIEEVDKFLDDLSKPTPEKTEEGDATATPPLEGEGEATAAPEVTPAGSEEVDRLRAEVERLKGYQHKYDVLMGKYNAEVPRLAQALKDLETKLVDVTTKPEQPRKPDYEDAYNDLVEEHGPTTAKNMLSIAEAIAQEKIAAIQERFEAQLQEKLQPYDERVEQLAQSQAQTAEQRFYSTLDVLVPDWKKLNGWGPDGLPQDPKFAQFLDVRVPGTRYTYNQLLLTHAETGDVEGVKEIFDIFKARNTTQAPSKGVEQFIDPSKTGRGTTAPPSEQKPTYSRGKVDAFFDSLLKGTFRGTREEASRLESEYSNAILEGRVK